MRISPFNVTHSIISNLTASFLQFLSKGLIHSHPSPLNKALVFSFSPPKKSSILLSTTFSPEVLPWVPTIFSEHPRNPTELHTVPPNEFAFYKCIFSTMDNSMLHLHTSTTTWVRWTGWQNKAHENLPVQFHAVITIPLLWLVISYWSTCSKICLQCTKVSVGAVLGKCICHSLIGYIMSTWNKMPILLSWEV